MRASIFITLTTMGLGIKAWPQAQPVVSSPDSVCPAGPLPADTVLNHQVTGAPFYQNDASDGHALMEGDLLANGGRQIWAMGAYYGTLYLYLADGTQASGFPMNLYSQCTNSPEGAFCMKGSSFQSAVPLDDTGKYACGVQYRRQPKSSIDGTTSYRFIRPDRTFFPWSFDTEPSPDQYSDSVQEVTGLRSSSGRWGVFGASRRSFSDNYPITPAMLMVDSRGNHFPGWSQYGAPGYTIRGISAQANTVIFPANLQPTVFPTLVQSNYGLAMTGDGQVKPGFPISFPYTGTLLNGNDYPIAARVNGMIYKVFQVYQWGAASNGMPLCDIHLYSENGIEKPGWPVHPYYTDTSTGRLVGGCGDTMSFGDLDGDGVPELIVLAPEIGGDNTFGLFAFHFDGSPMQGFPVAIPGIQSHGQPVIGDIDGDGKPEIVFSAYVYCVNTNPGMLFAYHENGMVANGFPMDYAGDADPGSLSTPILDDFNGDGTVDIISTPARTSGNIYVTTLNAPYNRDTIEWPMLGFDVMRTGWYRKMQQPDRTASFITASAGAVPGDGATPIWVTAHSIRPNSQPIMLPDQFARFGRLPDDQNSEFTTFQDNGNGSWSQKLTAEVEDPVTYTVSGWINEFKLTQTVSVTFWGRPRTILISPRAFPIGGGVDASLTGANYGVGVTLRALSSDLQITNAVRVSETAMSARFDVPSISATPGLKYFVANAYGRDSSPAWVLAYDPNDLTLLLDKTAGTTINWYGKAAPNYQLLRDTLPSFPAPVTLYSGPAMTTTDAVNQSFFYLVIAN